MPAPAGRRGQHADGHLTLISAVTHRPAGPDGRGHGRLADRRTGPGEDLAHARCTSRPLARAGPSAPPPRARTPSEPARHENRPSPTPAIHMYDPFWAPAGTTLSAIAEGAAGQRLTGPAVSRPIQRTMEPTPPRARARPVSVTAVAGVAPLAGFRLAPRSRPTHSAGRSASAERIAAKPGDDRGRARWRWGRPGATRAGGAWRCCSRGWLVESIETATAFRLARRQISSWRRANRDGRRPSLLPPDVTPDRRCPAGWSVPVQYRTGPATWWSQSETVMSHAVKRSPTANAA
jgi:hypothetical protein